MKTAFTFLFLFLSTVAFTAEPEAPKLSIKGAEKAVPSDDFVELEAELPKVKPEGWVGVTYEWRVFFGLKERKFLKTGETVEDFLARRSDGRFGDSLPFSRSRPLEHQLFHLPVFDRVEADYSEAAIRIQ